MKRMGLILALTILLLIPLNRVHAECVKLWFGICPYTGYTTCSGDEDICCKEADQCSVGITTKTKAVCDYLEGTPEKSECTDCIENKGGMYTGIGCIKISGADITKELFRFGVGMAGGIAFLLILFGGFQILVSSGNPERIQAGKELVASAVTGLILILMSVFLLQLIGYNILGIPGFG